MVSEYVVGGGFFTGRYRSLEDKVEPGSRFDPEKGQGQVRLSHTSPELYRLIFCLYTTELQKAVCYSLTTLLGLF